MDAPVAVSREPVGTELPALTAVTERLRRPAGVTRSPVYCPPNGAFGEGRPHTELDAKIRAAYPGPRGPRPAWLYDAVAIDDSTFVVLTVGWKKWAYKLPSDTFGLYVFDGTEARTAWLSTDDNEHKPLAHFQLREFDPAGNLVLVHEKERTRLKKVHKPSNWYWMAADTPLASFPSR